MEGRLPPRRPTPKLYECYRRGWHSEEHSKIRARMMRLILQNVLRLHQTSTTESEAFSVKLPRIVLRLEEIIYSRAKSQAEYEEEGTVIARLNEAVSTIVGGEDGPPEASEIHVMKPCVEAALSLSTVASPRPPRIRSIRKYAAASTRGLRAIRPNVQTLLPNPGFRIPAATSPAGVSPLERRQGDRGFSPLGPGQPAEGGGGVPDFPQPPPMREPRSDPLGRTAKSRGGDGSGVPKRDRGGRGGGGTGGKQVSGQQLRRVGGPLLQDVSLPGGGQVREIDFGLRLAAERGKRQEHAEPKRLQGGGGGERGEQTSASEGGGVPMTLDDRGGRSPRRDRGDSTSLASLLTLGGGQQQFGVHTARPSLGGLGLHEQHVALDTFRQVAGGPAVPALAADNAPGGRIATTFDLWAGQGAGAPPPGMEVGGGTSTGSGAGAGVGAGAGAGPRAGPVLDFSGNAAQVPPATWLLFLRRACLCVGGAVCVDHSMCERGQRLWLHLTKCSMPECGFDPMCVTSRALLQHLQDCQVGFACPICGPIAQAGNPGGTLPS